MKHAELNLYEKPKVVNEDVGTCMSHAEAYLCVTLNVDWESSMKHAAMNVSKGQNVGFEN